MFTFKPKSRRNKLFDNCLFFFFFFFLKGVRSIPKKKKKMHLTGQRLGCWNPIAHLAWDWHHIHRVRPEQRWWFTVFSLFCKFGILQREGGKVDLIADVGFCGFHCFGDCSEVITWSKESLRVPVNSAKKLKLETRNDISSFFSSQVTWTFSDFSPVLEQGKYPCEIHGKASQSGSKQTLFHLTLMEASRLLDAGRWIHSAVPDTTSLYSLGRFDKIPSLFSFRLNIFISFHAHASSQFNWSNNNTS